jgi:hypothetical protein
MVGLKHIIFCGDFNALLDPETEWTGKSPRQDSPFIDWFHQNELHDPLISLNEGRKILEATCRRQTRSGPTWSRIDRFVCKNESKPWFKKIKTLDSPLSDHSALLAHIDTAGGEAWSPRYIDWRAYNDADAVTDIKNNLRRNCNTPENEPITTEWPRVKKRAYKTANQEVPMVQKQRRTRKKEAAERARCSL